MAFDNTIKYEATIIPLRLCPADLHDIAEKMVTLYGEYSTMINDQYTIILPDSRWTSTTGGN